MTYVCNSQYLKMEEAISLKKNWKRYLSGLLAAILIMMAVPVQSFAKADAEGNKKGKGKEVSLSEVAGLRGSSETEDVTITSVTLGETHSAALASNGDLYCWGGNEFGQVGNGSTEDQSTPVKVLGNVTSVSLGSGFSAAITRSGELYCWGNWIYGQVGNGRMQNQLTPVKILENITSVALGWHHCAAVTAAGDLYCWGENRYGQVGNNSTEDQFTPLKIMGDVVAISLGEGHSSAVLKNGDLYCWGRNELGQVGNGSTDNQLVPARILKNVASASLGDFSSTAITTEGDLYCWGENNYEFRSDDLLAPVKVLDNVASVSLACRSVYAVTRDKDLYCMGTCVIDGVENFSLTPVRIIEHVSSASPYLWSCAAVLENGELFCWGTNYDGEVGDGSMDRREDPTKILDNISSVSMGEKRCAAVTKNGELYCWGRNDMGQVGNGSTEDQLTPVKITFPFSNAPDNPDSPSVRGGVEIDALLSGSAGNTIAISGKLTLDDSVKATEANLSEAIDSISFGTTDAAVAKVISCTGEPSADHRSADLTIWAALYNEGNAVISAGTATGSAECQVTVEADTSKNTADYEGDYSGDLTEMFMNKGMLNVVGRLQRGGNFTATSFVYEKDSTFGSRTSLVLTDMIYRGWDGWRDLIDASTSTEDAEKILASLLNTYQSDCEELAKAKKAQKYAKLINDAFADYSKATNMLDVLNSNAAETVTDYFSEDHIAKMLYEGKYDELMVGPLASSVNGKETPKEWNSLMEGFSKSAEMSNALKNGVEKVGGGLNDLGKCLKYMSMAQDTVNYLYQMEALMEADEMYCEMLLYIKANCGYEVVRDAAASLYNTIQGAMSAIISDVVEEALKLAGEKILDSVLDKACDSCLPLAIIKAGYDWGVTISNTFFKTGTTQQLKDSLRTEVYLAECLARWTIEKANKFYSSLGKANEQENARGYYYSIYMLWQTRMCAEETLQSLLSTTHAASSKNYTLSVQILNGLKAYRRDIFSERNLSALIGVTVSCPVNVEVYDTSGKKLLTVKDGAESSGYKNGIYYYCSYHPLDDDYVKCLYYEEGKDYTVKLVGNDIGLVDCVISGFGENGEIQETEFLDVAVNGNTSLTFIPSISDETVYQATDTKTDKTVQGTFTQRSADPIAAEEITLSGDSPQIRAGEKARITAAVLPSNATEKVVWSSDDKAIATVNSDGVVRGISVGTTTIRAAIGELEASCTVIVREAVKTNIRNAKITLSAASYAYNGKSRRPAVTVKLGQKKLKKGTDYTVSYRNNKNIGTATVIVTGKGSYSGSAKASFTIRAKKGTSFAVGSNKYKITGSKTAAFSGLAKSSVKKVTIPKTVKIGGRSFLVTSIASKALQNKKVTSVSIGANIKSIGSSAFAGCKRLGTVTVKSTKLKNVGKNAFKGVRANAKIKVPAKKLKAYKKLLRNKGQGKNVKITK